MKNYKIQDFIVKGNEIFVGLEDSKRTWKIADCKGLYYTSSKILIV